MHTSSRVKFYLLWQWLMVAEVIYADYSPMGLVGDGFLSGENNCFRSSHYVRAFPSLGDPQYL